MKEPKKINFSAIFAPIHQKMRIQNKTIDMEFKANEFTWIDREISSDDENLKIGASNPNITYEGQRVLLYIKNQNNYSKQYKTEYKFHIAWCKTLADMKRKGKSNRYVVSRRQSNIFPIRIVTDNIVKEITKELHVCKNCLEVLDYQGYKSADKKTRKEIYNNFSLKEFFEANSNEAYFHDFL